MIENVTQPFTRHFTDDQLLWLLRTVLVLVATIATLISVNSNATMYEMVEAGYSVTLVTAFAPMALGIYWSRSSTQGAWFSLILSIPVWLGTKYLWLPEEPTGFWDAIPAQLYGLAASVVGLVIGSLLPQFIRQSRPDDSDPRDSVTGQSETGESSNPSPPSRRPTLGH